MDCNSVAASLCQMAEEGFEVSIRLFVIANKVRTASGDTMGIATGVSDISDLMKDVAEQLRLDVSRTNAPVLTNQLLQDIMTTANTCRNLTQGVQYDLRRAGDILRRRGTDVPDVVILSRAEQGRWPFFQRQIKGLLDDLQAENNKLFLILLVIRLARSRQVSELNSQSSLDAERQQYLIDAIKTLQMPGFGVETERLSKTSTHQEDKGKHVRIVEERADDAKKEVNWNVKSHGDMVHELPQISEDLRVSNPDVSPPHMGNEEPNVSCKSVLDQSKDKGRRESSINKDHYNKPKQSESDKSSTKSDHTRSRDQTGRDEGRRVLQLHFLRPGPRIWDNGIGIGYFYQHEPFAGQKALEDEVTRMKSGSMSLVDQLSKLSSHEDCQLHDFLALLHPKAVLISAHKEEAKEFYHDKITFGGASSIRVIVETPEIRPMFLKSHIKHLDPQTLDAYNLPWEWDKRDSDFLIIRRWIPESDQDILFEHTRKLRNRMLRNPDRRMLIEVNRDERVERRGDSFGEESDNSRDNSDNEGDSREVFRGAKVFIDPKSTSGKEERLEGHDFVKELLLKYTTLSVTPKEIGPRVANEVKPSVEEPTLFSNEVKLPVSEQSPVSPNESIKEKFEFV